MLNLRSNCVSTIKLNSNDQPATVVFLGEDSQFIG